MNKLKNTKENKIKVLVGTVLGMSILGYILGKGNDKKSFLIGGAFVGLLISAGTIKTFVETEKNK